MASMKILLTAALAVLALAVLAADVPADVLQLKDGRIIEGKPLEQVKGGIKIKYKHGDVFVPQKLILDVIFSNPDGTYKPRNDKEAEKLAKGFVPYKGKWIPKKKLESLLKKQAEKNKERVEEAKKHKLWRSRYKSATKNFAFEYTIPKETAKEFMDLFEVYYKTFTKAWGIRPGKKHKLKVCFYHDQGYFDQVSGGKGALGYFRFVEPIELNVFNMRNDKDMTISVIFHEVNHYLTHLINPKFHYSLWVNEGLAEYYGSSKWDPKKKKMTVGHIQEGRLVSIKDDIDDQDWLGLEEMINMEGGTIKHYTWGWSFCHFMLHTPKYAKKFKKFYKTLGTGKRVKREPFHSGLKKIGPEETIKLLKKFLGVKDLKTLEKEWHAYIKTNLKSTSARGYVEAARMASRNNLPLTALGYFEKAIKAGGKSHRLYYLYGKKLWEKDKNEKAVEILKKAIEIDPLDPYAYMYTGLAYKDMGGNKKESERFQRLAMEIDPDNDDLEDLAVLKKRIRRSKP